MKKNPMTIGDYINRYETDHSFSNAGGNFPGDLAFDGADFQPTDLAFSGAAGASAAMPVSKPYSLTIVNATAGTLNAVLFGFTDNYNAVNFGSPAGITIGSGTASTSYQRLLAQSNAKPFTIVKWLFISTNTAQLNIEMTATYWDANGRQCTDPIPLWQDPYQQLTTSLEYLYELKVDCDTQLTIPILANTTLQMYMFPQEIADMARALVGGSQNKSFVTPQISGCGNKVIVQAAPATTRTLGGM